MITLYDDFFLLLDVAFLFFLVDLVATDGGRVTSLEGRGEAVEETIPF